MRYLHRVAESERFIAKGVYRSYQGDILLPERESWTRHRLAGGGILTRIDCDEGHRTVLAEVLTDEVGQIARLHIREWDTSPQATYHTLRVDYIFFPDYVQVSRRLDDAETDHDEVHFPPHSIINLPFVLYASVKFKRLAEDLETSFSFLRFTWRHRRDHLVDISQAVPRPDMIYGEVGDLEPRYLKTPTAVYYATLHKFIGVDDHNIPLQLQDGNDITILTEYAHI